MEHTYKVRVTKVGYCVTAEDIDSIYLNTNEDTSTWSDERFEEEINFIKSRLPQRFTFFIECEQEDLDELICNEITERTGWLIYSYRCKATVCPKAK